MSFIMVAKPSVERCASAALSSRKVSSMVEPLAAPGMVTSALADLRKPDGLVIVGETEIRELLDPLPIRKLFGLGAKTAPKVEALGIHTLGELRRASAAQLRPVFGRYAERVIERAAGIDGRPVVPDV